MTIIIIIPQEIMPVFIRYVIRAFKIGRASCRERVLSVV